MADLNYPALFPRVAALVHHGGAGTTHAAARAGRPQVITPMFGDQPYWAARVLALGIGTSAPAEADALAQALQAALAPAVAEPARAFAPRVATDGAATAAARLLGA